MKRGDVTDCQVAQTHHHVADHKESGLTLVLKMISKRVGQKDHEDSGLWKLHQWTLSVVNDVFSQTASVTTYTQPYIRFIKAGIYNTNCKEASAVMLESSTNQVHPQNTETLPAVRFTETQGLRVFA